MNRRAALTSLLKALPAIPLADNLLAQEPKALGEPESARTKTLEPGAALLQGKTPLNSIHAYVCGFHCYDEGIPFGVPQLMMGFTADGQASQKLFDDRDKGYSISTVHKKTHRADIPDEPIAAEADAWSRGDAVQIEFKKVAMKGVLPPPQ